MQIENIKLKVLDKTKKISQTGWRTVRFGDVVRNVNTSVKDALEQGIERFVGLEHLDPESLHIKRWGNVADGTSFTRKFESGQVLFGKRRAYQRKAAVADFEGICSGDILVFEPKGDELLPELLPFVVQSDGFFEHALGTSAGSLSPRTKWSDLARYEFALPPKDEQRRIAEILWAADETQQAYLSALLESNSVFEVLLKDIMEEGFETASSGLENDDGWQIKSLSEIATVERGKFAHRPRNLPKFYGGKYPFVQTGDVASACNRLEKYEQTLSEEGKAISRSFPAGTILMTIAAIIGKTAVTNFEVWATDSVVGIVPNNETNVYFLEFYLRTIQKDLDEKIATQTAQKNINLAKLKPLQVPIPSLEKQNSIANLLLEIQEKSKLLSEHISFVQSIKKKISESFLSKFISESIYVQ
jgi:type I restriction enzyme, S subunit